MTNIRTYYTLEYKKAKWETWLKYFKVHVNGTTKNIRPLWTSAKIAERTARWIVEWKNGPWEVRVISWSVQELEKRQVFAHISSDGTKEAEYDQELF